MFIVKGFPIEKVMEYIKLKKPSLVINDLEMQYSLLDRYYNNIYYYNYNYVIIIIIDRRKVYSILQENDIDVPKYYVVDRESGDDVIEMDDTLDIKGCTISKPFVEKPVSAEDHSIYVYFPSDYGGGSQRLFRKV